MNQNKRDLVSELLNLPKFGNGTGLHRMRWLCTELMQQEWLAAIDAIKVTGSNGKGSVCAMIAAILEAMDISYGLYTSPHLQKFNERIVVDGRHISDEELSDAIHWFNTQKNKYADHYPEDTIGAFEAFTAMAIYHFDKRQPQAVITEAGIGGRYDSTRMIPGNVVGLTSLDFEHTKLLGDSLEMIAYDKADMCPEFGTLVVGSIDPEVLRRLKSYCSMRHINLISVEENVHINNVGFEDNRMVLDLNIADMVFENLNVGLQGYHQISNAAVAILLVRAWLQKNHSDVSEAKFLAGVEKGLAAVKWPGRFQKIHRNPDIFIDVGHTPAAIEDLIKTMAAVNDKPILLVTGVSIDKTAEEIVSKLVTIADAVICTSAYHKGRPASEISEFVKHTQHDIPMFEAPAIEEAVQMAKAYAQNNNMTVLIAGGLFLAIEAAEALKGNNPRTLRFF